MQLRFDLPAILLALHAATVTAAAEEVPEVNGSISAPPCPRWSTGVPIPPEHSDEACDLILQNDPTRRRAENDGRFFAAKSGALYHLKDEQTWICPEDDDGVTAAEDNNGSSASGAAPYTPTTRWILRNCSTNPVSIALIDPTQGNLEVSALNPKIHPPHHDPKAVLKPGQRAPVDVSYGSILNVRELRRVGDEVAPGRILVRHRVGPYPVGKSFGARDAVFSAPEQVRQLQVSQQSSEDVKSGGIGPEMKSTTPLPPILNDSVEHRRGRTPYGWRKCNSLNQLFVNRSGRPLNVYYAGAVDTEGKGSKSDREAAGANCDARLVFPLGTDSTPRSDFLFNPETNMYFEDTYVGHRFVAKLQSDPSTVVEEIVIERTEVRDCLRERKAPVRADSKVGLAAEVFHGYREESEGLNQTVLLVEYDSVVRNATKMPAGFIGVDQPSIAPERTGEVLVASATVSMV